MSVDDSEGEADMEIEEIPATLGAIVRGVRLAALAATEWRDILDAFHARALLIFPAQWLRSEEQVGFARRFGHIEDLGAPRAIVPISNVTRDGSLLAGDDPVLATLRGNESWHTDSSYMPVSAKASVLSAHELPASGGETEWADMRAAYDALDPAMRERVAKLSAYHSIRYAQARLGYTTHGRGPAGYGHDVENPPLRPLVKRHPVTGRSSLFIGRHAHAIPGMSDAESEALLDGLMYGACRPPRVHRHRWQPGDVAVWDNRCLLHRACPYDPREPRVLKHTRIAGDPATESA